MLIRKKIFTLVIILLTGFIIGTACFLYRSIHSDSFNGNGTKEAVVFQDYGDYEIHDLEYVTTTKISIEGNIKRPLFSKKKFNGTIDIAYFSEQEIVRPFQANNIDVDKKNGVERVTTYQHFLSATGKPLAGFPVDLRLFFCDDISGEILKVSWSRREDYVYWLVRGTSDEGEAKKILEDFFARPKEEALDVLFY